MTRHLIYIHSRDHRHADRGWAYDVPDNSVFESDCDLDALLKAVNADRHLPFEEQGYRKRGPFFYCGKCNGIVLEWDSTSALTIEGLEQRRVGVKVCADCWHKMEHNIVIVSRDEKETA